MRSTALWTALMHGLRPLGALFPSYIYSHLWFKGPFDARVAGVRFRMEHVGGVLENEVFWKGRFVGEQAAVRLFANNFNKADVFFDVGANTGFFSLLAKATNPHIKVVAFEPSQMNNAALVRNIRLNGFDIDVKNAAVTSEVGEVTLYDFPGHSYSASLRAGLCDGTIERKVEGITLDDVVHQQGLAGKNILLKIDVEGHEASVLAGAKRLLNEQPTVLIEVLFDDVMQALLEMMPRTRFSYSFVDEASGRLVNLNNETRLGDVLRKGNYLITPR